MKKKALVLAILTIFALNSCESLDPARDLPGLIGIQKPGHNIKSFEFINIPSEGIPRGCLDDYNIQLIVTYDDDTTYNQPINTDTLPRKLRDALNTVGTHNIEILFRGEKYPAVFKILPSSMKYTANYYDYQGNLISHQEVEPGQDIVIPDPVDRDPDYKFIYHWEGWEIDLSGHTDIYKDYDIYPVYSGIMKRYHMNETDPIKEGTGKEYDYVHEPMIQTSEVIDEKTIYTSWFHVGRSYRAPILIGEISGEESEDYYFFDYGDPEKEITAWIGLEKGEGFDNAASQVMRNILLSSLNYRDNHEEGETHFTNEYHLPDPNGTHYEYVHTRATHITDVFKKTTTRLKGEGTPVPFFTNYIGSYLSGFENNYYSMTIPAGSSRGYYRLVVEADVDIFVGIKSRIDTDNKLLFMGAEVMMTYDSSQVSFVMDYRRDASEFNSTNKLDFTYLDIAFDAYTGVIG